MTVDTHVLINAGKFVIDDGTVIERRNAPDGLNWRVAMHTHRGGRSEGVRVVEIDNGVLCIDVLPTRGMGIWRVRRSRDLLSSTPGGAALGWQSPADRLVHPSFVPLMEPAGLGWLEGFNELLCRCGLESNGPPEFDDAGRLLRPLHGRIANQPAHYVELVVDQEARTITLRGVVDEARFHFQSLLLTTAITTSLGSNEFSWDDGVENVGGRDALMQMLYHFNLGKPLLQAGTRIDAPVGTVAPLTNVAADEGIDTWNIMPPPRPDSAEQVYVADLAADTSGNTRLVVSELANGDAVSLKFNKRALPCFTLWRNTPAEAAGYVLGIEPATNFPNPRTFEQKHQRVVHLKHGEQWRAKVDVAWLSERNAIDAELKVIANLQEKHPPQKLAGMKPEWSPSAAP
jgi:hypothetical protein